MDEHDAPRNGTEGYADLLGAAPDPALRRLVADLDTAYSAPTPPPQLLSRPAWEQLAAPVGQRAPADSRLLFGGLRARPAGSQPPAGRRGWFGMAAGVALFLA